MTPEQQQLDAAVAEFQAALMAMAAPAPQIEQPQPIGVPAGFVAYANPQGPLPSDPLDRIAHMLREQPMPARYFEGDELNPAGFPESDRVALQRGMAAAGLLTGPFRPGVWGAESRAAFAQLLAVANTHGLTFKGALDFIAANPPTEQPQLPMRPADPDDLADQAEAMFREKLGRAPNADELQQVAMRWNRYQREAFEAEQAIAADDAAVAQGATPDETLTTVDPESRMRRFFEDRYGGAIDRAQRRDERAQRQPALDASLSNIPVTGQF